MSDSFEYWFFPELEREEAAKAKQNILQGFWKRGLIETENNPELVLGDVDEVYGPTEKLAALYSKPDRFGGVSLSLWTRGMGVHEGFAFDGFELSYIEKVVCSECQTSQPVKATGLIGAMETFYNTQIIPEIKCKVCGVLQDARRWQSEPRLSFSYLGFKPYVLPLNDPDFEDRISWVSAVSHRTDEKRTVPAGDGYDSYEVFVFEEVAVNLSSKNWAATLKDRKNLGKCFNRKTRPKISSLNLNALGLREAIKPGQTDAWPNIWQITEVIKSSDGHSAIVFTSSYCGGLCAWGGFYLFEKSNGNWKVIGTYTEWVA